MCGGDPFPCRRPRRLSVPVKATRGQEPGDGLPCGRRLAAQYVVERRRREEPRPLTPVVGIDRLVQLGVRPRTPKALQRAGEFGQRVHRRRIDTASAAGGGWVTAHSGPPICSVGRHRTPPNQRRAQPSCRGSRWSPSGYQSPVFGFFPTRCRTRRSGIFIKPSRENRPAPPASASTGAYDDSAAHRKDLASEDHPRRHRRPRLWRRPGAHVLGARSSALTRQPPWA